MTEVTTVVARKPRKIPKFNWVPLVLLALPVVFLVAAWFGAR